ncbi:aminotransferase class V-fold PLP-dependent enzyme, partial [Campylobacter sp. MOP51]
VICYSPKNLSRVPIFAFNIRGVSPYDFAATLSNDFGIQTRAGCACAGPYGHDLLGLKDNLVFDKKPGWVRVSLHYTHTKDDV